MALHANFAGTFCISESLAQEILHIYYTDGEFPARVADPNGIQLPGGIDPETNQPLPDRFMAFDLFMAEPLIIFEPRPDDRIALHLRLNGTLTFSSPALPTIVNDVQIDFDIAGSVAIFNTDEGIQLGLDLSQAIVTNFNTQIYGGPDPEPVYKVDVNTVLNVGVTIAVRTMDTSALRFSPPFMDELQRLNLIPSPNIEVQFFQGALTVGIDVVGLTSGDPDQLVDMIHSSTVKGYHSTYSQSIPGGTGQYGDPIYNTGWTPVQQKNPGAHPEGFAVSLNASILNALFVGTFRQMILDAFEEEKAEAIEKAQQEAIEKNEPFDEPSIAKLSIQTLNLNLQQGHVLVSGDVKYESVTAGFDMKMRLVSTSVDGSTEFVHGNQDLVGIRPEIYDININVPWWVTFIQVMVGVIGVALAYFTAFTSAIVAMFAIAISGGVIASELKNGSNKANKNIAKLLGGQNGVFVFNLPGTDGPEFRLRTNDIVIGPSGFTSWFTMNRTSKQTTRLRVRKYPGSNSWPVHDRNPMVVELAHLNNFYHPNDRRVRIRWKVFGVSKRNLLFESDKLLNAVITDFNFLFNPRQVIIDHAKDEWDAYESFLVTCRVYRPWGVMTQELWSGSLLVPIEDRLHRHKPYVKWTRNVFYKGYTAKVGMPNRKPLGWVEDRRKWVIHKTDPDERCRFADQYTPKLGKDDLDYLDVLPFPETEADMLANIDKLCAYCFYGGPDKSGQSPPPENKWTETAGSSLPPWKLKFKKGKDFYDPGS